MLTVRETTKLMEQRLQEEGFMERVPWRDGRGSMRLDSYAELVARTTTAEATNTGTLDKMTEMGQVLVKMTAHNTTCKVCAPRQGRVYRTVEVDQLPEGDPRREFPHIREGMPRWPTYKTVHPNCAHRLLPYIWNQKTETEQQEALKDAKKPFDLDPRGEAERKRYEKAQKEHADRLRDRKEWEKIKRVLPDDAPSFSGYRQMRAADSERYNDLRYAMKVEDKSVAGKIDYTAKEWYNKHQEVKADLVGFVAVDGVKITGVSHHISERILDRSVTLSDIKQSLETPYRESDRIIDKSGRPSKRYYGEKCFTVLNPDTGNMITVINKPRKTKKGGS
ncbi:MAG: hypothetical protein QM308_05865 [Bacillota bacterium]|nr:hypothetical protein [Bacillota bacterium]